MDGDHTFQASQNDWMAHEKNNVVPDKDSTLIDLDTDIPVHHQSMGERWGETDYATVIRQAQPAFSQKYDISSPAYESHQISLGVHGGGGDRVDQINKLADLDVSEPSPPSTRKYRSITDEIPERTSVNYTKENSEKLAPSPSIPHGTELNEFYPSRYYDDRAVESPPQMADDSERCFTCNERVYVLEMLQVMNHVYHKRCFKCQKCKRVLNLTNYGSDDGLPYCETHYAEKLRSPGSMSADGAHEPTSEDDVVHSSTSAVIEEERPPPQITQSLVAKFRELETAPVSPSPPLLHHTPSINPKRTEWIQPSPDQTTQKFSYEEPEEDRPQSGIARQLLEVWNQRVAQPLPVRKNETVENYPAPNTARSMAAKFNAISRPNDRNSLPRSSPRDRMAPDGRASPLIDRQAGSAVDEEEQPVAGITKNLVAMFTSLSSSS